MDQDAQELLRLLSDPLWRLNNLYKIVDAQGRAVRFRPNAVQLNFYQNMHDFNVILKGRQLGFSTFIDIWMLDQALFKKNFSGAVIAQGLTEAEDLFKNKIKFAYDNLPAFIKAERHALTDSARKLELSNGSSITVGTSMRGGTFQALHVSEYGKIAARYPEKALEIKTGALNTVHAGQKIFIESTAEGQGGEFYELCQRSRRLQDEGRELTALDPKFHFYGWYEKPEYTLDDDVVINQQMFEYFDSLPVKLTAGQKAWYVKKAEQQGDYMKREYPSTPDEAFEQSMEGAYYTRQMTQVRKTGQICRVPHEAALPVYTFWDIGLNDSMAIWFFQHVGLEYRFINYYQMHGEGFAHYANYLQSLKYNYAQHIWPHDGAIRQLGIDTRSRKQIAESLGIYPIKILQVTKSVNDDIETVRSVLPRCWFDQEKCAEGIKCLDNYRKEWDDRLGTWKGSPRHDDASHGADAFRYFAVGYEGRKAETMQLYDRNRGTRQMTADNDYDMFA